MYFRAVTKRRVTEHGIRTACLIFHLRLRDGFLSLLNSPHLETREAKFRF